MHLLKRIEYLDGLRGIAVLMVVFSHFIIAFFPALVNGKAEYCHTTNCIEVAIAASPLNIFYNGNFAIYIFFTLSGYVLSYKFFRERKYHIIVSSALGRYFRLLVPVLFSIVAAYICMSFKTHLMKLTQSGDWLATFLSFMPEYGIMLKEAFFGVFFNNQFTYNQALWTMPYELIGSYIVFGLLLFSRFRTLLRYTIYALAGIWLYRYDISFVSFILGLFLSDLMNHKSDSLRKHLRVLINERVAFFVLAAGLLLGSYPTIVAPDYTFYGFLNYAKMYGDFRFFHIMGAFFIMTGLLFSAKIKNIFSNKAFVFLGKISFSIYVIHLMFISYFSSYLFLRLSPFMSYFFNVLVVSILSIALIILCAYYVDKYVDQNGIKLSKLFSSKICNMFYNKI